MEHVSGNLWATSEVSESHNGWYIVTVTAVP